MSHALAKSRPFGAPLRLSALAGLLLAAAAVPAAGAAEVYVATGLPYALVGVAFPVADRVVLRADYGSIGHHGYSGTTPDNNYAGSLKYNRFAAFADWFVAGSFRLTGGVSVANGGAEMKATAKNNSITIGGTVYDTTGDIVSKVSLPSSAPYLGIGWGHAPTAAPGLAFHADLGASIGKAKATPLKAEGALAQLVSASDLAAEDAKWQASVGKVKAIPQFTLGASYRF